MKVIIPAWKAFLYVEVYLVLEWKDNSVYRTQKLGHALATRPRLPNEIYASLSVSEKDKTLELNLLE